MANAEKAAVIADLTGKFRDSAARCSPSTAA